MAPRPLRSVGGGGADITYIRTVPPSTISKARPGDHHTSDELGSNPKSIDIFCSSDMDLSTKPLTTRPDKHSPSNGVLGVPCMEGITHDAVFGLFGLSIVKSPTNKHST